jgi:uncharacterized protein (DUF885 family)
LDESVAHRDPYDLPRPEPSGRPGPLDDTFYDMVEARARRLLAADPILATWLGVHAYDDRLGDGGRDAVLDELAADRDHLRRVESLDPVGLSGPVRFERDLDIHNVRRGIFDLDVVRIWERRSMALETVGDAIFLLFVRDHAPLADRLAAITGRLEGIPSYLSEARTRPNGPQVRLWQDIEIRAASELPELFAEVARSAEDAIPSTEQRRLERAIERAGRAVADYAAWLESSLRDGTDDWAIGRAQHDAMVDLRAFDGLDADAILELGWQRLAEEKQARVAAAREVDRDATEADVVDRIKSDQPVDFDAALNAYRDAMLRARAHLVEHDLVSIPADERIDVMATPEYLRGVMPFAAYFAPGPFDRDAKGIYVVTPSVDASPTAMREHNLASISNTSIHEAYPGHHLQLDVARRHPSLTRLLTDAPEFVEGWGMYSELMMREHGFDDDPSYRVVMHTDAIWRACRIILDVRMHRGELSVDEATDFLIEHTGFERPNAAAEVRWYTYRPTYPLSYLLGRTLLLQLRDDERRRLGDRFELKTFHDTLLRNGSLPVSFHRRLLAGEGA